MSKGRCLVWLLFFVLLDTSLPAQDRRVIVVNLSEKELLKEANRLGICPDRLKNGREALRAALVIAPEVSREIPVSLSAFVIRYERKTAQTLISSLFEKLLDEAAQTNDLQELATLQLSALDLISALDKHNPSLAKKLESRWPRPLRPSTATGEGNEVSIQDQIYQKMKENPEEALLQLPLAESGGPDLQMRSRLLQQLWEEGKQDAARQLLDESTALIPILGTGGQPNLGAFLHTVLGIFPDSREALLSATSQWYAALSQMGGADTDFRFPSGETIRVSSADVALLNQLAALRVYPEFCEQMAAISPALQNRIQSAGGMPWLFRPVPGSRTRLRKSVNETPKSELEKFLAGVSSSRDARVALSELCRGSDLEKTEKAFSLILRRIEAEKEPTNAASEMMSFGSDCVKCLGELPDDWYSTGRNIVRRLREAEEQDLPPLKTGITRARFRRSFATDFEAFLFEKKARTDFAGVMGEVRAMEEKPRAFLILMRIIQDLGLGLQ